MESSSSATKTRVRAGETTSTMGVLPPGVIPVYNRKDDGLSPNMVAVFKFIAHSPDRLAQGGALEPLLLAQSADMHVHGPRGDVHRVAPDALQKKFAGENAARVFHQGIQQVEFLGRQDQRSFLDVDGIGGQIERHA